MLCLLTGCFHESPDPLAPGGMVDPTKVNVEVNVSLDFTIDPFVTQSRAGSDFYRRFIVDLYRLSSAYKPECATAGLYNGSMDRLYKSGYG